MPKRFTEEEKSHILARVSQIGAAAAAKEAGASYNSVLRWVKEGKLSTEGVVKDVATLPGEVVEQLSAEIEKAIYDIRSLEETLKIRKAELKNLQKAKAKAEKKKELFDAAEEKKRVVQALMSSSRSVDEILEYLKK